MHRVTTRGGGGQYFCHIRSVTTARPLGTVELVSANLELDRSFMTPLPHFHDYDCGSIPVRRGATVKMTATLAEDVCQPGGGTALLAYIFGQSSCVIMVEL